MYYSDGGVVDQEGVSAVVSFDLVNSVVRDLPCRTLRGKCSSMRAERMGMIDMCGDAL